MTGLELNMPKCVLVPLWHCTLDVLREELVLQSPFWSQIAVQGYGKYLGFMVGPQALSKSWEAPLRKFSTAARDWGKLGLGLYYSSIAYSTYVLPILSFVAQLSAPPVEAIAAEEKALRDIIPGPYRWILPEDLYQAGELYGQGRSFPSLAILAKAAQARVYRLEAFRRGGLKTTKSSELSDKKDTVNRTSTLADSSSDAPAAPASNVGVGHTNDLESTALTKLWLGALVWVFLGSEVAEECLAIPAEAVVLHGLSSGASKWHQGACCNKKRHWFDTANGYGRPYPLSAWS